MLHDGAERQRGEICESAHDQDHADHKTDEQSAMGGERAFGRRHDLLCRQRARHRQHRHDHQEAADQHREAERRVIENRVGADTRECAAVVSCGRCVGVENFAVTVRAGIERSRKPRFRHGSECGKTQNRKRQDKDGEHRHLHLARLDLLAEIFRRAPDHEPCDEHRDRSRTAACRRGPNRRRRK